MCLYLAGMSLTVSLTQHRRGRDQSSSLFLAHHPAIARRLDIRVQAEEIGRIIRVFQGHQPFVVGTRRPDTVVTIVRPNSLTYAPTPANRWVACTNLRSSGCACQTCGPPLRHNQELMMMFAVGKGGLLATRLATLLIGNSATVIGDVLVAA